MVDGAVVTLKLWAPDAVIPPIDITAIIDTGAPQTIIQEGLGASLGLTPTGTTLISSVGTKRYECNLYRVRLLLTEDFSIDVTVMEGQLYSAKVPCFIGRDVLKRGIFIYTGATNTFSFSL